MYRRVCSHQQFPVSRSSRKHIQDSLLSSHTTILSSWISSILSRRELYLSLQSSRHLNQWIKKRDALRYQKESLNFESVWLLSWSWLKGNILSRVSHSFSSSLLLLEFSWCRETTVTTDSQDNRELSKKISSQDDKNLPSASLTKDSHQLFSDQSNHLSFFSWSLPLFVTSKYLTNIIEEILQRKFLFRQIAAAISFFDIIQWRTNEKTLLLCSKPLEEQ